MDFKLHWYVGFVKPVTVAFNFISEFPFNKNLPEYYSPTVISSINFIEIVFSPASKGVQ
jgi:hypothetical protein